MWYLTHQYCQWSPYDRIKYYLHWLYRKPQQYFQALHLRTCYSNDEVLRNVYIPKWWLLVQHRCWRKVGFNWVFADITCPSSSYPIYFNNIEMNSFMSVNSSIGGLRIAAYPFCNCYGSHLQQKMPNGTVYAIRTQINYVRILKPLVTSILFPVPPRSWIYPVSVLVSSDAEITTQYLLLFSFAALLIGPLS